MLIKKWACTSCKLIFLYTRVFSLSIPYVCLILLSGHWQHHCLYTLQKNAFEWGLSMIPHSEDAVQVTQHVANFLVRLGLGT